jgi:hypothetical protein
MTTHTTGEAPTDERTKLVSEMCEAYNWKSAHEALPADPNAMSAALAVAFSTRPTAPAPDHIEDVREMVTHTDELSGISDELPEAVEKIRAEAERAIEELNAYGLKIVANAQQLYALLPSLVPAQDGCGTYTVIEYTTPKSE